MKLLTAKSTLMQKYARLSFAFTVMLFTVMKGCHPVHADDHYKNLILELNYYVPVIIDSDTCKNNPKSDGWYKPRTNVIHLCKENIVKGWPKEKHQSVFKKVLMHEAVHLAQDCKAGFNNKNLSNIDLNIDVPKYVVKRYNKKMHKIEAEAFFYWHKGNKPLELVKKYC